MAKLRPITHQALTDVKYDIKSRDITIKEGEQYEVAERLFNEDPSIIYFNYWSDADLEENGFYTYPIERADIELHKKYIKGNDYED